MKACTYCPEATDLLSRLPKPGSVKVFEPKDMISAAVRKYHPEAQDRMLLYINLGMLAGRYSRLNRSNGFALHALLVSINSGGIESTDSYTANIIFHTILVKIRNRAANSTPIELPLNKVMKNAIAAGKKPSIGTDCKMSTIGIIILDANGLRAAVIPTIIATINDTASAKNIL
jgi:hypothetical protein